MSLGYLNTGMALLGYTLLLLISFYLLAFISNKYFISSLVEIAKKLKMSSDAAGATLMAAGSSAPELFIVIIAILKKGSHAEIGIGTIVGSALFNILVIVGSIAIVRKAVLIWKPVLRDLIFYSISVILLLFAFWDNQIDVFEAFIFILFYVIYIITIVKWKKISPDSDTDDLKHFENNTNTKYKWKIIVKPIDYIFDKLFPLSHQYYLVFFISIVLIAGLCWILVYSAIEISGILHIPEVIIALVVLAIGTSVP
ncbi:MAG: hypothetical protein K8R58_02955, partial [Bacteroidales bacterium]|nr:hypothetical protein [Bacteroidales bacterium]